MRFFSKKEKKKKIIIIKRLETNFRPICLIKKKKEKTMSWTKTKHLQFTTISLKKKKKELFTTTKTQKIFVARQPKICTQVVNMSTASFAHGHGP